MEKWVLVIYCDPAEWPEGFNVEATPQEIRLLEEVDNVHEDVAWDTLDMKQAHIIVLHYLGKSRLYENEEEFDREMKGWRDDEGWDQDELDLITWSNYGKWNQPENLATDGECMGAWRFYHIHADA